MGKKAEQQEAAEKEAAKLAVTADASSVGAPAPAPATLEESVSSLQEMDPWMVRKLAEKGSN